MYKHYIYLDIYRQICIYKHNIFLIPTDRCIYKRDKSAGKPECIKGSMTFTMKLKSGAANCTETMTKVKNCRNKGRYSGRRFGENKI